MKTVQEILKLSVDFLASKGFNDARKMAEDVLVTALGVKRFDLYLDFSRTLTESEIEHCRKILKRASLNEPLQYIEKEVEFLGVKLAVNPDVLIPRQETELLADLIVKAIPEGEEATFWDICTGSGALGLSVAQKRPKLRVILSDVSEKALQVAKDNAKRNQLKVEFRQGDLLLPFQGEKADYIVCNPPYITEAEYVGLDPSVKDFEPKLALVSGESGLECYARMAASLKHYLNTEAKVWFELGKGQGASVQKLFKEFSKQKLIQDLSSVERFFYIENI